MSQTVFTDGLGYEGKVTLTLKSNRRIIKSKTYKNSGTALLFKFLGLCLMDSFEEAKKLLPNQILLLYNTSNTSPTVATPTAVEKRSAWQSLAQTPSIISDSAASRVSVVYSFEVPKAIITGPFNQVALYGAGMSSESDIREFSAFYYLTDSSGAFEAQDPDEWSATTVLLIEWELSLSNKELGTDSRN